MYFAITSGFPLHWKTPRSPTASSYFPGFSSIEVGVKKEEAVEANQFLAPIVKYLKFLLWR